MAITFRAGVRQNRNLPLSNDLEILSTPDVPDGLPPPTPPRRIPNFGHTVLFFTVAIIVLLLTSFSVFALGDELASAWARRRRSSCCANRGCLSPPWPLGT